jgi:hypothetical protein
MVVAFLIPRVVGRAFLLLSLAWFASSAQGPVPSPRDSTVLFLDSHRISIEYGKPSKGGRRIIGEFVPFNKIWRTGANLSTTFETNADLLLGDIEIPRGRYSLYTLPSPSQWKLIINKQTGQWGTTYNSDLDFARTNLQVRSLAEPVEQLAIRLARRSRTWGLLTIEWEYTSLSVPIQILDDPFVASPRDSVRLALNGSSITIDYGRPLRRGRSIIGKVVPYNEVWRTGANEATSFVTEENLVVGDVVIPRGSYSLYSLPSQRQWKLIINKETGQQGTQYDRALDFARIPLERESLESPVEQFTISLEKTGRSSCVLRMEWEFTSLSLPIRVQTEADLPNQGRIQN